MTPAISLHRLRWRPLHRLGRSREVARAAKATLDRRKDAAILVFDGRPAVRSTSIFAARSMTFWLGCRSPRRVRHGAGRCSPRTRAVPAVRSSAWSRARSRCCRGTGNGWRSNRAALRSHCAGWSTRQGAPTRTRIGSAHAQEAAYRFMSAMAGEQAALRRSGPRAVRRRCRAFRGIDRHSGRPTCAITPAGSPRQRSTDDRRRRG